MTTEVFTDHRATEQHYAAVRYVVRYFDEEQTSWVRYIVLDRAKVVAQVRAIRRQTPNQRCRVMEFVRPDWESYYGGPGRVFERAPVRTCKNKRFLVYAQMGGLDI